MSRRRRRRRASERRLEKIERRMPFPWWLLPLILALVLVVGLARAWR
ncbi:MAG: hypothetical protein HYX99_04725 [Chloroflexi bacterium]|nr:hypothetical protein [Chloroflexota bacterium]